MSEEAERDKDEAWLQKRADAFHGGDFAKALQQVVREARLRHEHYLKTGIDTNYSEPLDPWGGVQAENQEKRAGQD